MYSFAPNDEYFTPIIPIGKVIREFQVDKKIGGGAYSSVYRAHNIVSGTKYALKFLPSGRDEMAKKQAKTEIRVMKMLNNTAGVLHLVKSYEWGDLTILVLPYVGKDLDDLLGSRFLPGTNVKAGLQILNALEGMHRHHLIHRSVKPPNVCIKKDMDPKSPLILLDFGMACSFQVRYARALPYQETDHDEYHLRSYAPLNVLKPNHWTPQDDIVMFAFLLLKCAGDEDVYTGGTEDEKKAKKQALAKNPGKVVAPKAKYLVPFLEYVFQQRWTSLPNHSKLREILTAAAKPIPDIWTFRKFTEDGQEEIELV